MRLLTRLPRSSWTAPEFNPNGMHVCPHLVVALQLFGKLLPLLSLIIDDDKSSALGAGRAALRANTVACLDAALSIRPALVRLPTPAADLAEA